MNPLQRKDRPVSHVPLPVWACLVAGLALQVTWHGLRSAPEARARDLDPPPSLGTLQFISLGEPVTLSKVLMLRLQAFDNQPGISVPYRDLDYDVLIQWLDRILDLDPRSHYPLLAASRLYGSVPAPLKQRKVLDWVYERFLEAPNQRWQWLAHAVFVAKHRLKDLDLARRYAEALRRYATGPEVPEWAQQMEIFVLEDMGELQAAMVLLGGLIDSGQVKDAAERAFLERRLEDMAARLHPDDAPAQY